MTCVLWLYGLPYAMRLGFNMASTLAIIETEPVNAAGRQSSQPRQALLPSEYNAYLAAKSQLPGSGAMKNYGYRQYFEQGKGLLHYATRGTQHAGRSIMHGCQSGSLSVLAACQSWKVNSPQSLQC